MKEYDEANLNPMGYLKIFFRRKELFIIPAFVGLVLGICSGLLLPKQYKSSTIVLVQEGKTDNPLFDSLTVSTTVEQRLAGIRETILGWNSLVELIKRLELDKNIETKLQFEELIEKLRKKIVIKLRDANILDLSYVGNDADETFNIVKNVSEIFIERNVRIQNQETSEAIKFIEEQLQVYKGKIKSAEIAKKQEELDVLLIDSTEKHPMVQKLKKEIKVQKEELRRENLQYTEDILRSSQTNNPIIEQIRKALDSLESNTIESVQASEVVDNELTKIMLIDKLDKVLARDVAVNESIYNMLLQRIETAKITQRLQDSKEGTKYIVLDPPRLPLKPFKPNVILVSITGLFLGGILGVGLIVSVEFLDKSFIDVEEAKNYLGVPLWGAISKINTIETIQREREKQRWLYGVTALSGVFIVILAVALANFVH